MKQLLAALVIAVAFLSPSLPANAGHQASQRRCGESQAMKDVLVKKWGESPVASGLLTGADHIIVWYANDVTGTWSVVSFSPRGRACLVGAGKNFTRFKKPKGKPKGKGA